MNHDLLIKGLKPGISLMNRASFAKKFVTLGVLALASFAIVLYLQFLSINERLVSSKNEQVGLSLIKQTNQVVQLLQQHRGLSVSAISNKELFETRRAEKAIAVSQALIRLKSQLLAATNRPTQANQFVSIEQGWANTLQKFSEWNATERFDKQSELVAHMLRFQTLLADDFGITADPDLDTYYLGQVASKDLPRLLELLSQIRGYGMGLMAETSISDKQNDRLVSMHSLSINLFAEFNENLEKSAINNPLLKSEVDKVRQSLQITFQAVTGDVYTDILNKAKQSNQSNQHALLDMFNRKTIAIDDGVYQLVDVIIPFTEKLIQARIDRIQQGFYFSVLIALLVLSILMYFLFAIYFSAMANIRLLANGVATIGQGDLVHRIHIKSNDELAQVGDGFNHMSEALSLLIKKQHEENNRIEMILNNMTEGLITFTEEGSILSANIAAHRIFSFPNEAVFGQTIQTLFPQITIESLTQLADNANSKIEALIENKDAGQITVELSLAKVINLGIPVYICLLHDITEQQRNNKLRTEFVSTVSHELRTPLTAISGALSIVTSGVLGDFPPTTIKMLKLAYSNSQRLNFLINDLLDIEKLAAGKMEFDMVHIKLIPLVELSIESNRTYALERNVKLELTDTFGDVSVLVDRQRIQQVLSNLISNAIKFSPQDETVQLSIVSHTDRIRVTVADKGPGIPAEFYKRIFSKFSQADSSDTRKKGGTGLGLAISRDLVEGMNGSIGFDSVEGQGSRFYFEFPVVT
nr:ATP-binding protein [uncultured Undibacterium sp.]